MKRKRREKKDQLHGNGCTFEKPTIKSFKLFFMTNMLDARQTTTATSFVSYTMETAKNMSNMKTMVRQNTSNTIDAMQEISEDKCHNDHEQIAITGFRMDGDDTLMSAEERLQIISAKKNYKVSA